MHRARRLFATAAGLLVVPLLLGAGAGNEADGPVVSLPAPALSLLEVDAGPGGSGVSGQVWGEPACRKSSPPCMAPARTLEAHIRLVREASGKVVRETDTRGRGEFTVQAPPGRYMVEAVPHDGGTCDPVPVEVRPRRFTEVGVGCTI